MVWYGVRMKLWRFFPPNANRCLSNVLTDAGRPPKNPRSPSLGGGKKNARKNILCVRASGAGEEDDLRTLTQKTLVIGHRATLKKEDAATLG